jgi:hypothetical protein
MADEQQQAPEAKPEKKKTKGPKRTSKRRRQKSSASKTEATAKGKPWTFPKNTLEDAITVARAIEEKNAGNPMPAQELVLAVGFRQSSDWRFLELLRSANQYGIVTGSGATASISLTNLGQDIVAPSSPSQRATALLSAFRNVHEFADVERYYGGKPIPEDEFFLNTLTREFQIPKDRVSVFADVFVTNLKYLRAFTAWSPADSHGPADDNAPKLSGDALATRTVTKDPRPREFLDTCFVMMPFGSWFDRYYQEIYVPAIREAGYEPIRADELFSTGSVVEQIWEQIEKAKLLLADVSGKNPNVFYELGLAHAARKPVIFTTSTVDDVPFDLRHLRVISYDIREPEWASKLRQSVADYLRNATKEPEKSIPHPFRRLSEETQPSISRGAKKQAI